MVRDNGIPDLDFFKHIYTCFDCCFKTAEDKIYCSITLRVIDDDGHGDCQICEKFRCRDQDLEDWIDKVDDYLIGRDKRG